MQVNMRSLYLLPFAAIVVFLLFLWQGRTGFNLADEGYLWYGVQRVMLGETPIYDFHSYYPGRYYWSAALMSLWHDNGIISLRITVSIFQALGLFIALALIARSTAGWKRNSWLWLLISTLLLIVWMFPRQKLFDISLSIFLVAVLVFFIERPSAARHLLVGFAIGVIAFFGQNHGFYGVMGLFIAMIYKKIRQSHSEQPGFFQGLGLSALSALAGFLIPMSILAVLQPGFVGAFWDDIFSLFMRKSTNFPLPIPWPWLIPFASLSAGEALRQFLIGLFFVALPLCSVIFLGLIFYRCCTGKPTSPIFAATVCLTPVYAHYAYSRADLGHLCQGIFPFLLACLLSFLERGPALRWTSALALLLASFWVMLPVQPGWQCRKSEDWVKVEISGDKLLVDPGTASNINLLRSLAERYAPNGRSFIAAPFWPGAYAVLERRSPMWEIYPILPRPESFERKEIERIKATHPGFAIVLDSPLDGKEELRYRNSHPQTFQYIAENFELISDSFGQTTIFIAKD